MSQIGPAGILFVGLAVAGGILMLSSVRDVRNVEPNLDDFMPELDLMGVDPRLTKPFPSRLGGMMTGAITRRVERFLPKPYLENLDRQLSQAGLAGKRRACEQFSIQIGLALVAKIIGDHGGIVECESQPRHTVFRVLMPMLTAAGSAGAS